MQPTTFKPRLASALTLVLLVVSLVAHGQEDAGGKFPNWTKVDTSDQRRMYVDAMREANPSAFAGEVRAFAVDTVLPQLQMEANRGTIEVVRRKMRSLLLDNVGDAKAFETASRAVLEFMLPLARDDKADPLVRINAMLLIGELRSRDNKLLPWAGSFEALTSAAGDGKLPVYLRIAALSGLAQHVEAAQKKGSATAAGLGKTLAPVLVAIVSAPPAGDRAAADWLASRALDMLPVVMPELSVQAAAAVEQVLADATRPTDVRVRAAVTLGSAARPASGIKASQAVTAIRGLVIAALEADLQAVERHDGAAPSGPGAAAPAPLVGGGHPIPVAVGRRAAWRLAVLARAIGLEPGKGGLIELLPENEKVASRDLATDLSLASQQLDLSPLEQTMRDLLTQVRNPGASAPATDADTPAADADPFGK
jgi:hypothetical protein